QVAAAREVVIGVVVVEPSTRVRSPAFERPAVDDRAGGVCRSIGSVGPGGEDDEIVARAELEPCGQRQLLATTATSPPPDRYRRLTAGDQTGRRRQRPTTREEVAGDDPGRAFDPAPENGWHVTDPPRRVGGCPDDQLVVTDHYVRHRPEQRVARLRRLGDLAAGAGFEPLHHGGGSLTADLPCVEDAKRIRKRRRVRRRRTGGDHVERITDDVGEGEREDRSRSRGPGELAALEAREVLADGVELVDGGAGGEQQPRHRLLLCQRDRRGGRRGQRRGATGHQEEQALARPGITGARQQAGGRSVAARAGHWTTRLGATHAPRGRGRPWPGDART